MAQSEGARPLMLQARHPIKLVIASSGNVRVYRFEKLYCMDFVLLYCRLYGRVLLSHATRIKSRHAVAQSDLHRTRYRQWKWGLSARQV
jgi:hypothetical protein